MSYALVVCPSCKTPKGVEVGHKSTRCNGCGKRLSMESLRVVARCASIEQLQAALLQFNARRAGGGATDLLPAQRVPASTPPPRDMESILARLPTGGGQSAKLDAIARGLTRLHGSFDEEQFALAAASAGISDRTARTQLTALSERGLLVEAPRGRFRVV